MTVVKLGRMAAALAAVCVLGGWLALAGGPVRAQDGDAQSLPLFEPVRGTLNAGQPSADWTFEAEAGQTISVLVTTVSGDLDPVVELIGPDGDLVQENDDLDTLVRDAGFEVLPLDQSGTYTVRVKRYGATMGDYELTVAVGFADVAYVDTFEGGTSWRTAAGQDVPITTGDLRVRVAPPDLIRHVIPADGPLLGDLYAQVSARQFGSASYAEFGLFFRGRTNVGYFESFRFTINSERQWAVTLDDVTGTFVLAGGTLDQAVGTAQWTLAVLARGRQYEFFANGRSLGTMTDDRLPDPGAFGVVVVRKPDQADAVTVSFDNLYVTTRLGSTYRGFPLDLKAMEASDFAAIINELASSYDITPDAPPHDLYLASPESSPLAADEMAFVYELIGGEGAVYGDFVLGATVSVRTTGDSVGCGLLFRWQDDLNFDLAYVDSGGGFGLVQTRGGAESLNVYDLNPIIAPQDLNKVLIVAHGDRVALYVNTLLVAQERVQPGEGRVGLALLNYENVTTSCTYGDVWLWLVLDGDAAAEGGGAVAVQ